MEKWTKDLHRQKDVLVEAERYNDMVVEGFQESYRNLTVKTTFLLKWVSSSACSRAEFIFKVDDDVYVSPENLLRTIQTAELHTVRVSGSLEEVKYAMIGHVWSGAAPNRDKNSRSDSPVSV